MNTKTMEGLVGARTSMNLLNTPMRIYKEARRKGDTATMERAMGYVDEYYDQAEEYKAEADKGMEEDAREAREKAKLQQEEAIRERREENTDTDTGETGSCLLEISEEGKVLLKGNMDSDSAGSDEIRADAVKEPVTYTKTGETVLAKQGANLSVSV